MSTKTKLVKGLALGAVVSLLATGCASSDDKGGSSGSADGKVVLTMGGLPVEAYPEERKLFEDEIKAFEKENPDIKIKADETLWDQTTFAAQVAGGTLPTLLDVPYGEVKSLANRGQVKDLTEFIEKNEVLSGINDQLLDAARGPDGNLYGVPVAAYSIGLVINRDLFKQAGIDPDRPFKDWNEMAEAAKAITEKTGKPGFEHPATENYGGWLLSAMINGFGDQVLKQEGDKYVANLDTDAAKQALELLHELKWEKKVMGNNAIPGSGDVNKDFAAGQLGMLITGADAYRDFTVRDGFPKENYGTLPLPQDTDGLGTSGGGRIAIIKPEASDAEVEAAMKWIVFHTFNKYASEENALSAAKASNKDGQPVPFIGLPLISQSAWEEYLGWIEPEINVPLENLKPYLDSSSTMPIVQEPSLGAQELFAIYDNSIQAVLGREDANIPELLKTAQKEAEQAIAQLQE